MTMSIRASALPSSGGPQGGPQGEFEGLPDHCPKAKDGPTHTTPSLQFYNRITIQ